MREPGVISYNSVISACANGQQWEQAFSLLPEMRSSQLEPDVISYNFAISACAKGQQSEQALGLLPEMRTSQLDAVGAIRNQSFRLACVEVQSGSTIYRVSSGPPFLR